MARGAEGGLAARRGRERLGAPRRRFGVARRPFVGHGKPTPTTGSVEEIAGEATAGGATETSARAGDATRRERGGRAAPWNPGGGGGRAFDTRAGRRTLTDSRVSDVCSVEVDFGREPNDE
jgi:hypothetical protein